MTDNERLLYHDAFKAFGSIHQRIKAVEEMSELSKEILKNINNDIRNENEDRLDAISEEMADVLITLDQMRLFYGNDELIENFKEVKLKRLRNEIGKEMYGQAV